MTVFYIGGTETLGYATTEREN